MIQDSYGTKDYGSPIVRSYMVSGLTKDLLTKDEEYELGCRKEMGFDLYHVCLARPSEEFTLEYATLALICAGIYWQAFEVLVEKNLRLVIPLCKPYKYSNIDHEDLIQAGNIGLMIGIRRYDHKLGFRVSTFVTRWIMQAIGREVAMRGTSIHVPAHIYLLIPKIIKLREEFRYTHDYDPSEKELAKLSGETLETITNTLNAMLVRETMSLSAPIGNDKIGGYTLADTISSTVVDHSASIEESALENEYKRQALAMIKPLLEPREFIVFSVYNGLVVGVNFPGMGVKDVTLAYLGETLGVTRERVRQINVRATTKLRASREVREFFQRATEGVAQQETPELRVDLDQPKQMYFVEILGEIAC